MGQGGWWGPSININIGRRYPYYGHGYYPYYRYGYYRPYYGYYRPYYYRRHYAYFADTVTTAVGTMRDITGSAVV